MDQNKNLIVTLADANFINQAKQLFASVYFNAGWEGDYLLLACGIPESELAWFRKRGILVYEVSLIDNQVAKTNKYPAIVLSKFYLFKEYFKKWNKVIFLDADIIVKASLDRLLKLKGFNAPDATTFILKDEFVNVKDLSPEVKNKYKLTARAFCTGVFVFDTEIITDKTFDEIVSLYYEFKESCKCGEELILNLFFYKNWNMLPMMYNASPRYMKKYYRILEDKLLAFVIHFFCEKSKPWEKENAYYEEWSNNLKRAELIDLNNSSTSPKILNDQDLDNYYRYLKDRRWIYIMNIIYFDILKFLLYIDKHIGLLGRLIKRISPNLYRAIRLNKDDGNY